MVLVSSVILAFIIHSGLWLMQVYKDQTNVDDYLVQSIVQPTSDPNSGEVYYR